jgi:hypothetical protein
MNHDDPLLPQGSPLAVEPQDEALPILKITLVGVISLAVFAIAVVWATAILHAVGGSVTDEALLRSAPEYVGRPEIGIVDQHMFQVERRAEQMRASSLERLEKADWVSERGRIVRIPITAAMQAFADGTVGRRAPPPAPEPAPEGAPPDPSPPPPTTP